MEYKIIQPDQMDKCYDALAFAIDKHRGQKRKGGEPYIIHPVAVAMILMQQGYGWQYIVTGLFHDLLEDTDATEEEIYNIGGPDVLEAVRLLTKQKGYVMAEYVQKIRDNEIAFAVKGADRLHNLRCALDTDEAFKRRYILETIDWFMDFMPEIKDATKLLSRSLTEPIAEHSLEYMPFASWVEDGVRRREEREKKKKENK